MEVSYLLYKDINMEQDKEIKAMTNIVEALSDLDEGGRLRVVKYVLERLNITVDLNNPSLSNVIQPSGASNVVLPTIQTAGVLDIKTLKEQKNPRSAIQMAVLVAYYLQEVVPIDDRKETVETGDLEKYFRQAGYKLPAGKNGAADTLNNAKNAGYLEAAARGAFRLNPVGYNLVVHGLPENTPGYAKKKTTKKAAIKKAKNKR